MIYTASFSSAVVRFFIYYLSLWPIGSARPSSFLAPMNVIVLPTQVLLWVLCPSCPCYGQGLQYKLKQYLQFPSTCYLWLVSFLTQFFHLSAYFLSDIPCGCHLSLTAPRNTTPQQLGEDSMKSMKPTYTHWGIHR